MTIEELILICNLQRETQISPLQEWILREAWEGKTYGAMAQKSNYVEEYLRRTAANLWTKLSQGLNDNVTKYNLRKLVEKRPLTLEQKQLIRQNQQQQQQQLPSPPGQTLPLGSLFYLEHSALEMGMRNSLAKGNCLLRIQGAPKFGKTSFLQRLIGYAKELQYLPILVSCQDVIKEIAQGIGQGVSAEIGSDDVITPQAYINALHQRIWRGIQQHNHTLAHNLPLAVALTPPSQDELSQSPLQPESEDSSPVLSQSAPDLWRYQLTDTPLLLVITDLDDLLNQPLLSTAFRTTIEQWHHQANTLSECAGLSIVVTYTIEPANQPWQAGVKLSLPPLSLDQVTELARRYGLVEATPVPFSSEHCQLLHDYVGGHPFLVQQALYELWLQGKTCPALEQFPNWLQQAGQQSGCFGEYMRGLWLQLNSVPHWRKFLPLIRQADGVAAPAEVAGVPIPCVTAYELVSLAIIKPVPIDQEQSSQTKSHQRENNHHGWQWRCPLYENVLAYLVQLTLSSNVAIENVAIGANHPVNYPNELSNNSGLGTQSASDHSLHPSDDSQYDIQHGEPTYAQSKEQQIALLWQDGLIHQIPVAALLCQVDYYHTYRRVYGEAAAKECLQRIGQVLRGCLAKHLNNSYGQLAMFYPQDSERFLILLSNTTTYGADCLATNLRSNVKALNISTNSVALQVGGFPDSVMTISIGLASIVPELGLSPNHLLDLAQQGLDRANEEGGDRICGGGVLDSNS